MIDSAALTSWAYIVVLTPVFMAILLGLSASVAWASRLRAPKPAVRVAVARPSPWNTHRPLHG